MACLERSPQEYLVKNFDWEDTSLCPSSFSSLKNDVGSFACGAKGVINLDRISSRGKASKNAALKSLALALLPAKGPE